MEGVGAEINLRNHIEDKMYVNKIIEFKLVIKYIITPNMKIRVKVINFNERGIINGSTGVLIHQEVEAPLIIAPTIRIP